MFFSTKPAIMFIFVNITNKYAERLHQEIEKRIIIKKKNNKG